MTSVCYFAADVPSEWLTWGAHAGGGSITGALTAWVSKKRKQSRKIKKPCPILEQAPAVALGWSRHMRSITQDEESEAEEAALGLPKFQLNLGWFPSQKPVLYCPSSSDGPSTGFAKVSAEPGAGFLHKNLLCTGSLHQMVPGGGGTVPKRQILEG